jgi:hypothetical protein
MACGWKDFKAVLDEIRTPAGWDRSTAIVAVATLEYALVLAIERCSPISQRVRKEVLESESIKKMIDFAAKKGVIDQQETDYLHTLRKIRIELLMT